MNTVRILQIDSSKPKERRPFNRDVDLAISKAPQGVAGARKLQERAGALSSKFGSGGQKYL